MIKDVLDLLNASQWYGAGENVEIAKGKYAGVKDFEQMKEQLKRLRNGN
jgi:hypothetical protein|tara:strand:+ start:1188 stop:1334 length:147 start_codon:yes stop_codon:yes gene_type:complete